MVWQENTRVIVMTTREVEKGRVSFKTRSVKAALGFFSKCFIYLFFITESMKNKLTLVNLVNI